MAESIVVCFTLFSTSFLVYLGTFPIDLTKTRLQVQGQSHCMEVRYRGMFHALFRIGREEGIRALYSGWVYGHKAFFPLLYCLRVISCFYLSGILLCLVLSLFRDVKAFWSVVTNSKLRGVCSPICFLAFHLILFWVQCQEDDLYGCVGVLSLVQEIYISGDARVLSQLFGSWQA